MGRTGHPGPAGAKGDKVYWRSLPSCLNGGWGRGKVRLFTKRSIKSSKAGSRNDVW